MISKRVKDIQSQINSFVSREVTLVAVSKMKDSSMVKEAIRAGIEEIGENYVEEAIEKFSKINLKVKKHFIGKIQSNKVKKLVRNFDLIQSVCRMKVAKLIDKESKKIGKIMPILVQVNVSRTKEKSGLLVEDVEEFLRKISLFKNIKVLGLMCIGISGSRKEFKEMKKLFDYLNKKGFSLKVLSMGMTDDFLMAIEEGSTMVRVGRGIFGERT